MLCSALLCSALLRGEEDIDSDVYRWGAVNETALLLPPGGRKSGKSPKKETTTTTGTAGTAGTAGRGTTIRLHQLVESTLENCWDGCDVARSWPIDSSI